MNALVPWRKFYRPKTLAYITDNGNVLPCYISPFATIDYDAIVLGNVFDELFADIWSCSKYQNFRQQRQTDKLYVPGDVDFSGVFK